MALEITGTSSSALKNAFDDQMAKVAKDINQIATGNKFLDPSENPSEYQLGEQNRRLAQQNEALARGLDSPIVTLQTAAEAVNEMIEVMSAASVLVTTAISAPEGDTTLEANLKMMLQDMNAIAANANYNGKYLLNGEAFVDPIIAIINTEGGTVLTNIPAMTIDKMSALQTDQTDSLYEIQTSIAEINRASVLVDNATKLAIAPLLNLLSDTTQAGVLNAEAFLNIGAANGMQSLFNESYVPNSNGRTGGLLGAYDPLTNAITPESVPADYNNIKAQIAHTLFFATQHSTQANQDLVVLLEQLDRSADNIRNQMLDLVNQSFNAKLFYNEKVESDQMLKANSITSSIGNILAKFGENIDAQNAMDSFFSSANTGLDITAPSVAEAAPVYLSGGTLVTNLETLIVELKASGGDQSTQNITAAIESAIDVGGAITVAIDAATANQTSWDSTTFANLRTAILNTFYGENFSTNYLPASGIAMSNASNISIVQAAVDGFLTSFNSAIGNAPATSTAPSYISLSGTSGTLGSDLAELRDRLNSAGLQYFSSQIGTAEQPGHAIYNVVANATASSTSWTIPNFQNLRNAISLQILGLESEDLNIPLSNTLTSANIANLEIAYTEMQNSQDIFFNVHGNTAEIQDLIGNGTHSDLGLVGNALNATIPAVISEFGVYNNGWSLHFSESFANSYQLAKKVDNSRANGYMTFEINTDTPAKAAEAKKIITAILNTLVLPTQSNLSAQINYLSTTSVRLAGLAEIYDNAADNYLKIDITTAIMNQTIDSTQLKFAVSALNMNKKLIESLNGLSQ